MTTQTSPANFEGFSQILNEQLWEKVLNNNNLIIWKYEKLPYMKKKFRVPVDIDYADMRFSNFAIQDLCNN